MKRWLTLCLLLILLGPAAARAELPRVGICAYSSRDTFIGSLLGQIRERSQGTLDFQIVYAQNDQNLQNDQVLQMIADGVDILAVNPVDRVSAVYLIALARQHNLPLILFNREPLREDLAAYDNAYYVGIDPRQQGELQGKLAADYFRAHPEQDLNGDGIIQYVLLRGEPGHQDAELRSLFSVRALTQEGLRVQKLAEETAHWEKGLGQERMAMLLNVYGHRVELVIANNDDMALGAIDALKAAGYFSGGRVMPVVGVDATAPAREALKQGTLIGTVLNDAVGQGAASLQLARLLARGEEIVNSALRYPLQENRFIWVPGQKVVYEAQKGFPGV